MKSPRQADSDKILQRIAALCARSEQCSYDIGQKLFRAHLSETDTTSIMSRLIEQGFINDRRYARSVASYKVKFSGWGKRKIKTFLYTKHISADIIEEALNSIPREEYRDALVRVAKSAVARTDVSSYEGRQKILRFLLSRGFESQYAIKIISLLTADKK